MRLSISLASRNRPDLLGPTLETTLGNIISDETRIVVALDEDDRYTLDKMGDLPKNGRIIYDIRPQEDSLGEKYNRVLTIAPADVYMTMVDYGPHLTKGFDQKILKAATI